MLKLKLKYSLKKRKRKSKISIYIKRCRRKCCCRKETPASQTVASFEIENVHLWHGKKDPYLYTAEVCLKSEDEVLDNVSARFDAVL